MKLLIYGGTEHNVRCRIGKWQLEAEAPLHDLYAVPEDKWTVGVGILQGESFLFLKKRQITDGRVYPLTILCSPPREVWQKFGWNAARLALALISEKNSFRDNLLESPQNFGEGQFAEMIGELPVPAISEEPGIFSEIIAGSLFETEMRVINPAHVGAAFPILSELAENLEAIPAFARQGNGWLFGGSRENAKYLGMKLVFDTNRSNSDEAESGELSEKGAIFLDNWQEIEAQENLQPILKKFCVLPAWLWETELGHTPPEFLEGVNKLGELDKMTGIDDRELDKLSREKGVFADEIHHAALRLACRTMRPLTPERTSFLLQNIDARSLSADDLPVQFLDRTVVMDWLISRQQFPSASEAAINFTDFECFEICREIIAREPDPKNLPTLFNRSIDELRVARAEDYISDLAETVREKTGDNVWEIWSEYLRKDFFKQYLAARFVLKARELTSAGRPDWENIYLRLAADRGGRWLAENVPLSAVKGFLASLLQSPGSNEATAWLLELRTSPLRSKLTNEEKTAIARLNPTLAEGWRNFTSLMDLVNGQKPLIEKLAADEERSFLHAELVAALQTGGTAELGRVKNPLKKFFGDLPPEFIEVSNRRGAAKTDKGIAVTAAQPAEIVLNPAEIVEAAEKMRLISQMISQALAREENRKILLRDFWDFNKSLLGKAFPSLPVPVRALILSILFEENPGEVGRKAIYLFEQDEHGEFSLALWECILLTGIGEKIRQKMVQRFGSARDLQGQLRDFINNSVQKESRRFFSENPKKEESKVHRSEEEKGLFKRIFQWLFVRTK